MLCQATDLFVMVLNRKYLMNILTFWKKCLCSLREIEPFLMPKTSVKNTKVRKRMRKNRP